MIIIKGDHKFSMIEIDPKEMSNIFDAFQNGRHYLLELLKTSDAELAKAIGKKNAEIPALKKIMQEKVEFYEKHLRKILSYERKG
jgi:hypothetical protein